MNFIPRRKIEIYQLENQELKDQIQSLENQIQQGQDLELAKEINKEQYNSCNQNLTCQCCFDEFSWEEMGACSLGHLFCGNCILQFVNQCLFYILLHNPYDL